MPIYKFIIGQYTTRKTRIKILTGKRFGRLLVIGHAGSIKNRVHWHCLCQCGNGCTVQAGNLIEHNQTSCGCWKNEKTSRRARSHGESAGGKRTTEYSTYKGAKNRCNNPNDLSYARYGGRGIEFRFNSFPEFLAVVGRKPTPQHTLDRIDNDGHYEKGNLRWATRKEQNRNTRQNHFLTAFNETKCIADWSDTFNINDALIVPRVNLGWCNECAISIPSRGGVCKHKRNLRGSNQYVKRI